MSLLTQRRQFLKTLGLAGLSAATWPLVQPVLAANNAPRRAIFVYIPNGCNPSSWHPTGTETDFTLPAMTQPLNDVKDQCIFLQGFDMFGNAGTHEGGMQKVLTGRSGENHTLGVSVDVFLGEYFKTQTRKAFLNLGVIGNEWGKPITFGSDGKAIPTEDNPLSVYDKLFGENASNDAIIQRRRSLIDQSMNEVNQLQQRLGSVEKQKLDAHLEALRGMERRLATDLSEGFCDAGLFNTQGFQVTRAEYLDHANAPTVGALQTDLAVKALACDLTRVVTLKWTYPVTGIIIPESGTRKPCHQASHDNDSHFDLIKAWYVDRFGDLIRQLQSHPEGDGTLLDNTMLFLCSELGHGAGHDHDNMPFILAGGQAGGICTGRYLQYNHTPHNKILVSIAQFMGLSINQFGDTDNAPSGLPELWT